MPPATNTPNPAAPHAHSRADYLSPHTLARLGAFELRAKMIAEGVRSGMHESPYFGVSVEFAEHRQYAQGDDLRHLDWKVYGRSDKLYVKQYEQETNLDVMLLVDSSGSMAYGSLERRGDDDVVRRWTKLDHATAVAAAIAYLSLQQQDRVGLAVFADNVRAMVARGSASGHWRQIVAALNAHPVEAATSVARGVDQVLARVTNRVLMVIISDFFDDPELIRTAAARLRHRGHDLIMFQVLDRKEIRFDFSVPVPFLGLEGEPRVNLDPRALRSAYLDALAEHHRDLDRIARSFGFDFQRLDTHDDIGPALGQFLARRQARLRTGWSR